MAGLPRWLCLLLPVWFSAWVELSSGSGSSEEAGQKQRLQPAPRKQISSLTSAGVWQRWQRVRFRSPAAQTEQTEQSSSEAVYRSALEHVGLHHAALLMIDQIIANMLYCEVTGPTCQERKLQNKLRLCFHHLQKNIKNCHGNN